jgi:antitoxin component YwqK of YwqJK toxin-antitoxin module
MYAYKSAKNGDTPVVITLFIGENCKSNINRYYIYKSLYAKYRCNKAYVTKIEDDYNNEYDYAEFVCNKTNKITKYIKNQYTIADSYDENKENVNGSGIVFFINKDLARNYNRKLGDQIWDNIKNMYQTFYNNGCYKEKTFFIYSPVGNNIINHSVEEWYETGVKKYEKKFLYDNYKITEWYESGKIMKHYVIIFDKIDGIYTEWWVNGNLKTIKQYNNGLLNGLCAEWHINGNKRFETEYANGKIIEKYKKIYKNNEEIVLTKDIKLRSISSFKGYSRIIKPLSLPVRNEIDRKSVV